ncbi:MAG TPA: signal recognition particle-docking protein FtsY [Ktedonobacterales bacterium]
MFKRLRDGLAGRPAQQQDDSDQAQPATQDQSFPPETPSVDADAVTTRPAQVDVSGDTSGSVELTTTVGEAPAGTAEAPSDPDASQSKAKRGLGFNPFKATLERTRSLFGRVNESLIHDDITEDLWDQLEETLITGDVGVQTAERLMKTLRERVRAEGLTRGAELKDALKEELTLMLGAPEPLIFSETSPITVLLVVGVNGVGKTTSIAKLASMLKKRKKRVMLAAGDTFRAAAVEQLKTWGERIGIPVIAHQQNADSAAVVFDAMQAAQGREADVLIVDTAGRLHTKHNLMEELSKIVRVLQKYDPEAPHEVLLVIDGTTGQNGFLQAAKFVEDAGVSGVILTKLDGTARGGIVFTIAAELGLPIKYVGTGEGVNDIAEFDPDAFVDALFGD